VIRTDGCHNKCSCYNRPAQVVRVLPPCPRTEHQLPEAGQLHRTIEALCKAHGILHPGIGCDNEKSRKPGAEKYRYRRPPLHRLTEALPAVKKKSKECGLEKEGKHSFHCQRLADHAAGEPGKMRPVRAELEFHGDPSHHSQNKVNAENPGPEAGCVVVTAVIAANGYGLQDHDQQRQAHGELRKEVMESNGKGKVQTVNKQGAIHEDKPLLRKGLFRMREQGDVTYITSHISAPGCAACAPIRRGESRVAALHLRIAVSRLRSRGSRREPAG